CVPQPRSLHVRQAAAAANSAAWHLLPAASYTRLSRPAKKGLPMPPVPTHASPPDSSSRGCNCEYEIIGNYFPCFLFSIHILRLRLPFWMALFTFPKSNPVSSAMSL